MTQDREIESITFRDLFLIVRCGRATLDNQRELERFLVERAGSSPGGLGVAVLIPSDVFPPENHLRREILALLTRQASRIRGLVWVIAASGFHAAAIRAAATSSSVGLRQHYPTFIAGDLRGTLTWLLPLLGGPARLAELNLTIRAIEASDPPG